MAAEFFCPKCMRHRSLALKSKRKVARTFACTICDEQIKARMAASKQKEIEQRSAA